MTCMIGILRAGGDGKTGLYSDITIFKRENIYVIEGDRLVAL